MVNKQGAFNNRPNSKFSRYSDDIIGFSYSVSIDRLQLSLQDNRHSRPVVNELNSMFKYVRPIRDGRKIIQEFRYDRSLIEFIWWGRHGFNDYAVIVHDPDIELQNLILQLTQMYPMSLSQVEVAFDFTPDNPCDLYDLRRILTDGIVLKYSRAGCYLNYSGLDFRGTEYIGKKGVVRKGSKGLRVYNKHVDGKHLLRMELQFNPPFIRKNGITLPVHADRFDLFDFVVYRQPLDEDKLLDVLRKKWQNPIKRARDVEILRGLGLCGIYSWMLSVLICPSISVSDQIGRFKQSLKRENLAHRINEFFPKSGKKAMIVEAVRNGFVRRELSTKVRAV